MKYQRGNSSTNHNFVCVKISQINTCNGFYCDKFSANRPYKPTMWTEAWTGWLVGSPLFTACTSPTKQNQSVVYMLINHSASFPDNWIRFTEFGGTTRQRPVQDLAFAVARFLLNGGSYVNYYMVSLVRVQDKTFFSAILCYRACRTELGSKFVQFHGGTNFGRSAGGPFVTTSYDFDAPIDEYGEIST